jgi:hypothetical protein
MPDTMTVRERREVAAFRAVELRYFGHLHLTQGSEPSVEVEGDPDVVAKVHARVAGDTLILEIGETWLERLTSGVLLIAHRPLHYHVTVPELDGVGVRGTGMVDATGLVTSDLEVAASGAADVALADLEAHGLKAQISGRGSFRLAGRADAFELRISGSGEVDAAALACQSVDVRISGQGTTTVRVAKRLDVRISGLGTVRYHGDPTVTQTISGSGTVTQVDAG